jgi:hypothetical protein
MNYEKIKKATIPTIDTTPICFTQGCKGPIIA